MKPVTILTGLSDGTQVEVLSGPLRAGDQVVIDEMRPEQAQIQASHPLRFPH
jgi:multidrug efflux pump subunit AcrA (membrane-fusion protein)